jgi:hypothetical protein
LFFVFPRLPEGLGPASQEGFFCESYREYLETNRSWRPEYARVIDRARYELRNFDLASAVPPLPSTQASDWNREIYTSIVETLSEEVGSVYCPLAPPDSSIMVAIPEFEVGDPRGYVLWSAPFLGDSAFGDSFIELMGIRRTPEGPYTVTRAKTTEDLDDVAFFGSRIRQNLLRELDLSCSGL